MAIIDRSSIAVVIPAYKPGRVFPELVTALAKAGLAQIVVVDDGSGPDYAETFGQAWKLPGVSLVRHAVNLGKGAALKTGFNHVLCSFPNCRGVVTADADGQHSVNDILRVADGLLENPEAVVLGVRSFREGVPLRSRLGNIMTRSIMRVLIGTQLSDTQTGLRGLPVSLLGLLLKIKSSGYEFELDMLIAARHHEYPIRQIGIETIYIDNNQESHFNPVLDSMRIYLVLMRFTFVSLASALLDNTVFFLAFRSGASILLSQALARVASVMFNYTAARNAVFLSRARHRTQLPRYLLLVCASGLASYSLIRLLHSSLGISVIGAKLIGESLLFFANFCIQRDFVFKRRGAVGAQVRPVVDVAGSTSADIAAGFAENCTILPLSAPEATPPSE